jgi:hypothetical protein
MDDKNKNELKKEKVKLNKYLIFFIISTVGSIYIGSDSKLGMIFDLLALVSLLLLVSKTLSYNKIKKIYEKEHTESLK